MNKIMAEETDNKATQLRKGILELAVMATLYRQSHYGYSLVRSLASPDTAGIKEGTVYPILARLARLAPGKGRLFDVGAATGILLDLARRVSIEVDPDIDRLYPERYANRVEIALLDGRRFETRVDFARGSGEHPLSFAEVAAKFKSLAAGAVSAERADRIIDAVASMDALKEISGLARLLA